MSTYLDKYFYAKIVTTMPILCVDLLLYNNGKVLLCRRNENPAKGEWWFPGGRIFKGETLERAVIRKGIEELGIIVNVKKMVGVYETFFDVSEYDCPIHTVNIVFLVAVDSVDHIKLDKYHSEMKFVSDVSGLNGYVSKAIIDSGVFNE